MSSAAPAQPAKAEKKDSVQKLFIQRMKREGREQEWFTVLRRVQDVTGKSYGQAIWPAMKELGYTDPKLERELHAKYLKNIHRTAAENEIREERAELIKEQEVHDFESAVRSLPDKAAIPVELDWIRAHPAMARKNRNKNDLDRVLVDVNDILYPSHGAAPSKAAVYQLQHWCNCPHEFYKQLLSEHRKATEGEAAKAAASKDVGLEEIEQLLAEVSNDLAAPASPTAARPTAPASTASGGSEGK